MNRGLSKELENMIKRGVNPGMEIIELGDSRALTILDKPTSKKTRDKFGDCTACRSNDCLGCRYYG
jgi:hypothetical protein